MFLASPTAWRPTGNTSQHFIMIEENQKQAPTTQLNVVLNWFEELKR